MKNTLFVLFGIALSCHAAFAQKPPIKFGDIPMEDMKMTVYPLDSSAEAVVLADYGESSIEYTNTAGFQVAFERIRRIKILTKEGLKHAEFSIPLWKVGDREEKMSGLKVVTYNLENGKIVETKVKSDNFFKEEADKNLTITKVAWTNVKEGSVLEISYRTKSDFLENYQDWEFQSTIPVRLSEYRARMPEYFNYQKYMQGYVALSVNESDTKVGSLSYQVRVDVANTDGRGQLQNKSMTFQENHFRWAASDVPAFKREPFMTTVNDYISKMNFELATIEFPGEPIKNYLGNWKEISKVYWDNVKDDINGSNSLKDEVAVITAGAANDEEKVAKIFQFVRNTVLWDERFHRYPTQTPKKVLETKKGTSADINILLASMLEKASIPVNPVLISTRDHGFIRETTPASTQFNYVICLAKVGEKNILLDATTRLLPIGVIPERCLNGQGMVVSPEGVFRWISLTPVVKSRTMYTADISFTPTGELNTTLKIDKTGYHSAHARSQYKSKGEGEYVKAFASQKPWAISKSEFANVDDIQQAFKETHQLTVNDHATVADNTIYFNPFITGREDENPFKTEKREYPVDFGNTFEEMYFAKITIPDQYVVEELPATKLFALPENAGRYTYSFTQTGNVINLTSQLVINRPMFSQDQYQSLREFYNQMIAKQAEQVVLKKK